MDYSNVKHFKKEEFECKCGCGLNNISLQLVKMLDLARETANIPFKINSACRCESHNKKENGSPTSSHLKGLAVDISAKNNMDRFKIVNTLMMVGFERVLLYNNFIHVDIDHSKSHPILKVM